MYVWPLMTCSQCAAVLIQADIAQIIVPDFVEPYRWQESFDKAREMCVEAGIAVHRIPFDGEIDDTEEFRIKRPKLLILILAEDHRLHYPRLEDNTLLSP